MESRPLSKRCLPTTQNGGGVVWEHELYEPLSYNQDRTFLHTLEGDEYVIGFAFADEGEAGELYKKISNRQKYGEFCKQWSARV